MSVQTTYSVTKGRSLFPAMVRAAQRRGVAVVTKDDTTVAYLVSRDKCGGGARDHGTARQSLVPASIAPDPEREGQILHRTARLMRYADQVTEW
jgi:hypothetical protein